MSERENLTKVKVNKSQEKYLNLVNLAIQEFCDDIELPYSDKFWCGENLAQLAQNGKNRQIKSTPNLIFFSHCAKFSNFLAASN